MGGSKGYIGVRRQFETAVANQTGAFERLLPELAAFGPDTRQEALKGINDAWMAMSAPRQLALATRQFSTLLTQNWMTDELAVSCHDGVRHLVTQLIANGAHDSVSAMRVEAFIDHPQLFEAIKMMQDSLPRPVLPQKPAYLRLAAKAV